MFKIKQWKLDYISLFIIMLIYYGFIQRQNFIGDPDGFYHAKIAYWLSQGQLIKSLPWMKFSTLGENFTDHHFLYHILLAPFTIFNNPLIGVKIATVIFAALMVLAFYYLLKKLKISWPFLFSLGFLLLNGLNFRLSLVKANSVSLIVIYLLIYALFKQKIWLSLFLSFIFVWLYGGWPLAIILLLIYLISNKIYNYIHTNRLQIFYGKILNIFHQPRIISKNLKLSLALISGLILGIVINPYWPQNIYFYYQQIIQIGIVNMGSQFNVGTEWYSTTIINIISSAPHLFIALVFVFLILFFNHKKISKLSWFSFLLTFFFMLLTIKSRRYIEYYLPFGLLFVASGTNDVKSIFNKKKILKFWNNLSLYLKIYLTVVVISSLTLIMPSVYNTILNVHMSTKYSLNKFYSASQWLKNNTAQNTIVFHNSWDEWPILFYHNDWNYYLIGLDPTFMENYNSDLHKIYRDINTGEIKQNVVKKIKNNFQADYIFINKKRYQNFIENIQKDTQAQEVYQDSENIIYQIN